LQTPSERIGGQPVLKRVKEKSPRGVSLLKRRRRWVSEIKVFKGEEEERASLCSYSKKKTSTRWIRRRATKKTSKTPDGKNTRIL